MQICESRVITYDPIPCAATMSGTQDPFVAQEFKREMRQENLRMFPKNNPADIEEEDLIQYVLGNRNTQPPCCIFSPIYIQFLLPGFSCESRRVDDE